jgi:hypothetical protein
MHEILREKRTEGLSVREVRREKSIRDRPASELAKPIRRLLSEPLEENLARERVSVRVEAGRGKSESQIRISNLRPVQNLLPLDDPHDGAGEYDISAVSPPRSATPFSRHPRATPSRTCCSVSGSSLPAAR